MAKDIRKVHLVGSIPLLDPGEVFTTVTSTLGGLVSRLPDGETGERRFFIDWHVGVIAAARAQLEWISPQANGYSLHPSFRLRPGADASQIDLGSFGYAAWAQDSYEIFARLKRAGVIGGDVRFQINLPTAVTPVYGFFADDETRRALEPLYERALLSDVATICETLPADEIALQWDVCTEMAIWEGQYPAYFEGDPRVGVLERLTRLGASLPGDAQLGLHLCYGDYQHRHFMEPPSLAASVEIANEVTRLLDRPVNYVHMAVPRSRSDDAYFAPLADLRLDDEAEVFLGLVHLTDSVAGTRSRIATAERWLSDFGIATECGFGRRPAETVPELLDIHLHAAQPATAR